jgi:Kef-type K+ transport system membrane component KefB
MNLSSAEVHEVHNVSHGHNESMKTLEGGFLSGRSPFLFNPSFPLPTFIIQLLVIICMSRLVKLVLSPIKQPSVIAEIISGILLGPTAMGHIPYYSDTIFPKVSLPFLNLMSNFGLVLFLFLVGLELDPRMLKKSIKKSLAISLAGMALPFGVGVGTSYALYVLIEPPNHTASFTTYFLFLGVAMAITAFPVLARILTELNLLKTKVGSITVSAAVSLSFRYLSSRALSRSW